MKFEIGDIVKSKFVPGVPEMKIEKTCEGRTEDHSYYCVRDVFSAWFSEDELELVRSANPKYEPGMAPRVTKEDLEANIYHVEYLKHISHGGQVLRWAVLTTASGFAVTGDPSCAASAANDLESIGNKVALENAKHRLWALMGYELKQRMHTADQLLTDEMVQRFLQWPVPAECYPDGTPGQPGRTGTNLLDASQARDMLQFVITGKK